MTIGHVDRLQRARELLSAKGYHTTQAVLACYSEAGFDENLQAAGTSPRQPPQDPNTPMLVDLNDIYSEM